MKHSILINHAEIVGKGLHKKTDLIDWAIFDYIRGMPDASDDGHKLVNYYQLIDHMPLIKLNKKSSISNRLEKLCLIGVIECVCITDQQAFYRLNNNHNIGCLFCGWNKSSLEAHHYPIRAKDGGVNTINICANCHKEFHQLTDHGMYKILFKVSGHE